MKIFLSWLLLFWSTLASAGPFDEEYLRVPQSVRTWMQYEQKYISRDVGPSIASPADNRQNPEYAPESGKVFELDAYWIDAEAARTVFAQFVPDMVRSQMVRRKDGKMQSLFLVHPESRTMFPDIETKAERHASKFLATPTSSSRTLLVWEQGHPTEPFMVKIALKAMIGGAERTVSSSQVTHSVAVQNILSHVRETLPTSFVGLPEVFGVIPASVQRGSMLVRIIPQEVLEGRVTYLPMFSLYADPTNGEKKMAEQIAEKMGISLGRFYQEHVMQPFLKQWFELALAHGITMEPHAQNMLMELNANGIPTGRFIHRDFHGFEIDFDHLRKMMGSTVELPKTKPDDYTSKSDRRSFALQMKYSLDTFFRDGFVYNVAQHLKISQGNSADVYMKNFEALVEKEFQAATGKNQNMTYAQFLRGIEGPYRDWRSDWFRSVSLCADLQRVPRAVNQ